MTTYTANSLEGRTLLALRAGPMSTSALAGRFPAGHKAHVLRKRGLVALADEVWTLTAAGRAACPLRNPLATAHRAQPSAAPVRVAAAGVTTKPTRLPAQATTGGTAMPRTTAGQSAVDKVRCLLNESPEGVARKCIIGKTSLSEASVDNAIYNLIKSGEATRKSYGVIAATSALIRIEGALVPVAAAATPAAKTQGTAEQAGDAKPSEDKTENASAVEFSVYSDGRLAIIDGTEILVLQPDATRRLGYFLGCFEMNAWPPRLDSEAPGPHSSTDC